MSYEHMNAGESVISPSSKMVLCLVVLWCCELNRASHVFCFVLFKKKAQTVCGKIETLFLKRLEQPEFTNE